MNDFIAQLKERNQENWLVNFNDLDLVFLEHKTVDFYQQFTKLKQFNSQVNIFIVETNPLIFIAAFLAGISAKCDLFLCNNQWQEAEWQQVFNLVIPDLIIGNLTNYEYLLKKNKQKKVNLGLDQSLIMIPTGGTSGKIKFAIHTDKTLSNSVTSFAEYFNLKKINSFCILPLYHVSGLMQLIRSFLTKGNLYIYNYTNFKQNIFPDFKQEDYFISLVPTQLQYLLINNTPWLTNFKTILLGGAKPWDTLLNLARKYQLNLAPVYGMTETASNIVALKPEDFLKGNKSNGKVLNHSKIIIKNEQDQVLNVNQTGIITIESKSLCLGYYPNLFKDNQSFITDDLGYLDQEGYLYIIGRNSQKIITGGENVDPTEVENVILTTKLVKDICIMGVADQKWGEIITAIYVPINDQISAIMIKEKIKSQLANFKIPKSWVAVKQIPRNLQGKINYQQLKKLVIGYLLFVICYGQDAYTTFPSQIEILYKLLM